MRNQEQINNIKSRFSDPYSVPDFLTHMDLADLFLIWDTADNKIVKPTGPITMDIAPHLDRPVFKKILAKIEEHIGTFEITAGFFFHTDIPHVIHNDDTHELPDGVYKAITIPLRIDGIGFPKLCFFDQYYFHGPVKLFKNTENVTGYYNTHLTNYQDIDGLVDTPFDSVSRLIHLTHLRPQWLDGLSLHSTQDWVPCNAIIFDSVQLHCASNFKQQGIKSKLAISIFTKV